MDIIRILFHQKMHSFKVNEIKIEQIISQLDNRNSTKPKLKYA